MTSGIHYRSIQKTITKSVFLSLLGASLFLNSCTSTEPDISDTTKEYYSTYQERSDFDKFLNFYDENMVLEDIMLGERMVGKAAFASFFDWNNPKFQKLEAIALFVEQQIIQGKHVVTQGYFTSFKWGDTEVGTMYFTTILTFNDNGKIIKHVDWINYPNELVDYRNRKDSNSWIKP